MPTKDSLRLDNFLCFAVYSANLAFSRVYRPLLDPLGLTYVQYLCLVALWEKDGMLVGELGDRLFLASNTLTPVIKRLEALGYVRRVRDDEDERQVRVQLTEKAFALKLRVCDVPHGILTASGLKTSDIKALQDAMLALRERLLEFAAAEPRLPTKTGAGTPQGRRTAAPRATKGTARKRPSRATPRDK